MEVLYDTPIELTKKQYVLAGRCFGGMIARRVDAEGRYWVKLWAMEYKEQFVKILGI